MRKTCFDIDGIPTILWGENSKKIYLFVHGKNGCKEIAEDFAKIAAKKGWQVLSVDLPGHGERVQESGQFFPWQIVPELKMVMTFIKRRWQTVGLRADSLGVWFCLLAFSDDHIDKSLFVSPILDMEKLIYDMMRYASVSEERLKKEKEIKTDFAETLSWEYLEFAKKNKIENWNVKTSILYAENDSFTNRNTVDSFVKKYGCNLTVLKEGDHWLHTPQQISMLSRWTEFVA